MFDMFWQTKLAKKISGLIANFDDYLWRKIWGR